MKLVRVIWEDIVADLHTEDDIMPVKAVSVGFLEKKTSKYIRLYTTKYEEKNFSKLADKIVIPKGCIISIEELQ